jgi:hypothetical protein
MLTPQPFRLQGKECSLLLEALVVLLSDSHRDQTKCHSLNDLIEKMRIIKTVAESQEGQATINQ